VLFRSQRLGADGSYHHHPYAQPHRSHAIQRLGAGDHDNKCSASYTDSYVQQCFSICCGSSTYSTSQESQASCFEKCDSINTPSQSKVQSAVYQTPKGQHYDSAPEGFHSEALNLAAQRADPHETITELGNSPHKNADGSFTATGIATAIVLMVIGLVLVFFGHKLFKPVLFITGGFICAALTYVLLVTIESNKGQPLFGASRSIAFFFLVIVAGILGGLLFTCLWKLGLFAIGALLGFTLGSFILGIASNGLIHSETGRVIFLSVLALAGGIGILFIEKPMLVLGTAFPGSYGFFFGLDIFLNTGFKEGMQNFLSGGGLYVTSGVVYGMLGGVLGLAVIGCVVQFRDTKRKSYSEHNADNRGGYSSANEKV